MLADVGYWLGIEQRWRMFANAGITPQGWLLAVGRLSDGRSVDLVRGTVPADAQGSVHHAADMRNNAWRVYWSQITRDASAGVRPAFGTYLCRDWNDSVGAEALLRFYVLHVAILPVAIVTLMGVHFWRIRKYGGLAKPVDH